MRFHRRQRREQRKEWGGPNLTLSPGFSLPLNLDSPENWRRFPLSPSEGERVGERGPFLPGSSGAQSASNGRGVLSLAPQAGRCPATRGASAKKRPALPGASYGYRRGRLGQCARPCCSLRASRHPLAAAHSPLLLWRRGPGRGGTLRERQSRSWPPSLFRLAGHMG